MAGTWKDLTDNVNFMAGNLTGQVRGIARVVTAVANGDLNQKLTVEGDPMVAVRGDRVILRQALVNLIDNAVKYSPLRGNIFVRVGSNDGDAVVEVQDSGPGIPAEHRSKVFERFYRVDKARSREDGGTGLGLSIAEWAVGAHGGRIELDCGTEPGCIFRIRLPRFTTAENTIPPEQSRKT